MYKHVSKLGGSCLVHSWNWGQLIQFPHPPITLCILVSLMAVNVPIFGRMGDVVPQVMPPMVPEFKEATPVDEMRTHPFLSHLPHGCPS